MRVTTSLAANWHTTCFDDGLAVVEFLRDAVCCALNIWYSALPLLVQVGRGDYGDINEIPDILDTAITGLEMQKPGIYIASTDSSRSGSYLPQIHFSILTPHSAV